MVTQVALPARGGPSSVAAAPVTLTGLALVVSSRGLALSVVEKEGSAPPCGLGTEEARMPYGAKAAGVAVERPLGLALEASSFSSVT